VSEHEYIQKLKSSHLPQIKRQPFYPEQLPFKTPKTPHSLSYCVETNTTIGATHNAN